MMMLRVSCQCRFLRFTHYFGAKMDNTVNYRKIIKQTILRYAQFRPSHGNIRLESVFDETNERYLLMQTGWSRGRRVRGNLIYITLHNGKVYIEYDGIEHGITDELVRNGIPKDQIVLSYLLPQSTPEESIGEAHHQEDYRKNE